MNKGDEVIVKSFLNQPVVRRLWCERDDLASICREEAYQRWQRTGEEPLCSEIGKTFIFKYDSDLYKEMTRFDAIIEALPAELDYLWQKAQHYFNEPSDTSRTAQGKRLNHRDDSK